MNDKDIIHWIFVEFMKMMARAEKAEEEYETLRSQFEYIDRRRKDRLDKIIRNDT